MCNFKVGDKIKVVRSALGDLEQGSIHTAYALCVNGGCTYVYLSKNDMKNGMGWDVNRFVKYEEKEKQMKVEMGKKYRMVGTHEPVRIICTDRKDPDFPCVGLYMSNDRYEGVMCFHPDDGDVEEVPTVDWSKVKRDTPIWVKYAGAIWKRHFSGFDGKYIYFYPDGTTSFSYLGDGQISGVPEDCFLEEPK